MSEIVGFFIPWTKIANSDANTYRSETISFLGKKVSSIVYSKRKPLLLRTVIGDEKWLHFVNPSKRICGLIETCIIVNDCKTELLW